MFLLNKNIVLGVTGGIAAYKSAELVRRLKDQGANVRVVMTTGGKAFITPLTLQAVSGNPVSDSLLDPEAEKPDSKRINQLRKLIFSYRNKERNIDKVLKFHFKLDHLFIGSDNYVINYEKQIQKTLYEIKFRNGFNKKAFDQHRNAIKNSGSRYRKLKKINSPTLIIHGSDDTLIRPSHSKKLASLVHGSKLVIIKGMGHDFNKNFKNRINSIILPHILQYS